MSSFPKHELPFNCFLGHLNINKMAQIALLSKLFNKGVDSNVYYSYENSKHLEVMVQWHEDISYEELD